MSSLLRSTKFLRYFTGAARTLILNSTKATETSSLINPKALCATNNIILRDYATSKKTENLEPLLQKLDTEVRRFGRITKKDFDEIFSEICSASNISSSQSLLVIRCCGELVPEELPEHRTMLVQKIWNTLTERGIPMDISHYNALLKVYIENEHPFSPAKILEELEQKGLQANRVTYQRLMWRYCQDGDMEGATKVLEKMRELNMPVSEQVLNALVMGHAFQGDTEGAKTVLETMAGAGLQPSNHTYALLACGYARKGDIEAVKNVIKTSTEKDAYMTDKDILTIIENLAIGGHVDKVEQLFPHLHKGTGYNQEACNVILRLLNKGHYKAAKNIMKTLSKSVSEENVIYKGAFFIKRILRLNKSPEEVISICQELQEECLVPHAFYIATESTFQNGQVELAQVLFKEMQKNGLEIRQHYYWPLLAQKAKEDDQEGLLQIIKNMLNEGIGVSGETLRDYVIPYLLKNDSPHNVILKLQIANLPLIHSAINVMLTLLDQGRMKEAADIAVQYQFRKHYASLYPSLNNALAKTKDINSFVHILHSLSVSSLQNEEDNTKDEDRSDEKQTSAEIGRTIRTAVRILSEPSLIEKLLTTLYKNGLSINAESAEAIEQYLGGKMTSNISNTLSKLTSNDLEPIPLAPRKNLTSLSAAHIEQLLDQAKSKGAHNVNKLQKQLLTAYIVENNVEKVNCFLENLQGSDFQLTISTLAQLFEFYCQNDDIERAKQCKAKINEKDPNFVLSDMKVIKMVFALIRANRYEDAVNFLQENKRVFSDHESGFVYRSLCWQLLNTLAEQKDPVKVKEMTKLLIENNFIEPTNVILGPSIKVHLLNDDLDGALQTFEECCKKYRSTPWNGELMKTLIMKEDATKLQWLADLSTQVHGEVNILHDLVLAFVECGRLRQARRILETPGLHTRSKRLEDACQRYVEEGKSEHLEGLLEATKELSHIDRSNIFYHLLVSYCKANETDKALHLWTILQEEGEVPSNNFLNYLGKHLIANNREVPFVIPENKVVTKNTTVRKAKTSDTANNETTNKIETLIQNGQTSQAMDLVINLIENNVMPKTNVLKFLLKTLAQEGDVEKIQLLGKYLNDEKKRDVTFDDKLTSAIFKKGGSLQHLQNLLQTVQAAQTVDDFKKVLRSFPRSNALSSIMDNKEELEICQKVAETAAEKGIIMPANLLWLEFLLVGRNQEADSIWNKYLQQARMIMFRRLLQEAFINKKPHLIERLIETLKSNNNVTHGSLGNVYSRLINIYLSDNKFDEAKAALEQSVKYGIELEHIHKSCTAALSQIANKTAQQHDTPETN